MLNIFQAFPPVTSTNYQIARYDALNLRNNNTGELILIKTDDMIIEITKMKAMSTDSQYSVGEIEHRSVYDLQNSTITYYTIMHDKAALSYMQKTFADRLPTGYTVEQTVSEEQTQMTIMPGATSPISPFKLSYSEKYPNFHHSSIFYPEAKFLPEKIEDAQMRYDLVSVVTDDQEKLQILEDCKLDVEKFKRIMGEDVLRDFAKQVLGTTLEDLPETLKRMAKNW
jgi:hypothetical protein